MRFSLLAVLVSLPIESLADTCHSLAEPGTTSVASMVLRDEQDLFFTRPGAPFLVFEFACSISGANSVSCPVECDGGSLSMRREGEDILVSADVRIESLRMDTITSGLVAYDADGTSLDGEFRLRPAPVDQCLAVPPGQPMSLQPGDYLPIVTQLEQRLAEGGYFEEVPDAYFTHSTADAVKRFQIDIGLIGNGKVDRALIDQLGNFVNYVTGGC